MLRYLLENARAVANSHDQAIDMTPQKASFIKPLYIV